MTKMFLMHISFHSSSSPGRKLTFSKLWSACALIPSYLL